MRIFGWKPISYDFSIPSARIRCANIIHHFSSPDISLELFDKEHFLERYDAVIFSKKTTSENLEQALALKSLGKIVIFDICDNQFFDRNSIDKTDEIRESGLKEMFAIADYITTTNETLKKILTNYAPENRIVILEDALEEKIDFTRKRIGSLRNTYEFFVYSTWLKLIYSQKNHLIWFGTLGDKNLGTGIYDILRLKPLLERSEFKGKITLTICSNGKIIFDEYFKNWKIPVRFMRWNPATFYKVLRLNHVALIPVTANPLTLCKSNNRVITALYNNLAVIADEIPSYSEFSDCIALNDWEKGLALYMNSEARTNHIQKGQKIIEAKYRPDIIAKKWETFFQHIIAEKLSAPR